MLYQNNTTQIIKYGKVHSDIKMRLIEGEKVYQLSNFLKRCMYASQLPLIYTFCDVLPGWQTGGYGVMLLPRWQFSAPFQILQPLERALSCRRQTRWRLDATAKDDNVRVPLGGAQGARRRGRGSHPRRSCRRNVR